MKTFIRKEKKMGMANNVANPVARPELGRPQLGLSYKQVVNGGLSTVSWAASAAGKVIAMSFTPPAGMVELFDEYRIVSARLRLMFNATLAAVPGSLSYGHCHSLCFDPSGVAVTPADYDTILRYRNSSNIFLSAFDPVKEYLVKDCTHLSSDGVTLLSEPIKTDSAWVPGNCYIAPGDSASTEYIRYTIEYVVVYSKPRASA
jgi:hypothetical protein